MPSIFTQIIAGEIPGTFVFRSDRWVGMLDIAPVSPGHLLLIPTHEAALIQDLPSETLAELGGLIARGSACLRSVLGCAAVSVLLRDGPAAGQEVPHVHVHLIPRMPDDQPHAFAGGSYTDGHMATVGARLAAAWETQT